MLKVSRRFGILGVFFLGGVRVSRLMWFGFSGLVVRGGGLGFRGVRM